MKNIVYKERKYMKTTLVIMAASIGSRFSCRLYTGKSQSVLYGRVHFEEYVK